MTPEEAGELGAKVLQCTMEEAPLYEGTKECLRFVCLKHPLNDKTKERACHLLEEPVIKRAIEQCKEAMLSMSSRKRKRGDAIGLQGLGLQQAFANVYPPRGRQSAPWHRDVDTYLGSAIIVLQGDDADYVHIRGDKQVVFKEAPQPGSAIVLSKNCQHSVPMRKNRSHTRIALVIWF